MGAWEAGGWEGGRRVGGKVAGVWEMGGWEVGDGRATVTGKFDSIDSIVDSSMPVFAVGWLGMESKRISPTKRLHPKP